MPDVSQLQMFPILISYLTKGLDVLSGSQAIKTRIERTLPDIHFLNNN